jgi:hypothetical protein
MQWRESERIPMAFGVSAEILFEVDVMRDMMACESRDWAWYWSCDLVVFPGWE